MWPSHQKAAKQGEQPASADFTGLPKPAEPKLTDQGDASTQFSQGLKYENGEGVPKDLGKQQSFIKKRLTKDTLPRRLISAGSAKTGRACRRT